MDKEKLIKLTVTMVNETQKVFVCDNFEVASLNSGGALHVIILDDHYTFICKFLQVETNVEALLPAGSF